VLVLLITDFAAGTRVPVNLSVYRGGGSLFKPAAGVAGRKFLVDSRWGRGVLGWLSRPRRGRKFGS